MSDDVSQPCEREHHDATITILSKKKFVYIYIYLFVHISCCFDFNSTCCGQCGNSSFFFFFCNACITYYFVIITVRDFFRNQ